MAFSQYVKTEFDYIKHWDLGKKNVLAMRSYFGIAIPYGNSTNIPFAESFFAGGPNDNRAWTAYNLGPGATKKWLQAGGTIDELVKIQSSDGRPVGQAALEYIQKAEQAFSDSENARGLNSALRLKSQIYQDLALWQEAYNSLLAYVDSHLALDKQTMSDRNTEMQTRFNTDKIQSENEWLVQRDKDKEQKLQILQRNEQMKIIIIILVAIILVIVSVFAYKQLQIAFAKGKRELEGFSIPSLSTFRRYIKGLSKYEVDLARYGKKYAENENRAALKVYKTSFPLERIECDACEINIGLLNEDGTYAGKVTIFLVMDVFSRAILGYAVQVGHTKESAAAVIHSLAHSMRLKDDPEKNPMSGIGLCYVFDNGAGYRAEMTAKFLNAIGSDIVRCRSRRADEKPHVERAIGTMRQAFFKNLDGYLGKKSEVKVTEQTLKQAAKLSVSEFMLMFEDYIQNVYHHTGNRGINGFTPYEMWNNHIDEEEVITLADFDDRLMLRGNAKTLTCSVSGGIAHRGQRFHSHELKEIITRKLKNSGSRSCKMEVLIDDFDASAITVISDGIMIEVPNVDDVKRDQGFSFLKSQTKQIDSANAPVPMSARQAQAQNRVRRINGTHVESDTFLPDTEPIENHTKELEEDHAATSTITETERNATDGFGVDDE